MDTSISQPPLFSLASIGDDAEMAGRLAQQLYHALAERLGVNASEEGHVSELSRRSSIARSSLDRWHKGKATPRVGTLARFCRQFGIRVVVGSGSEEPFLVQLEPTNETTLHAEEAESEHESD